MNRDNKLSELEHKINVLKSSVNSSARKMPRFRNSALYLVIDLSAGLTIGALSGYHLDSILNTKPLFFFIFVILGICGGFYNFYKLELKRHNKK